MRQLEKRFEDQATFMVKFYYRKKSDKMATRPSDEFSDSSLSNETIQSGLDLLDQILTDKCHNGALLVSERDLQESDAIEVHGTVTRL